jgi:putative PIN family toxin of toxin-antitoxin system
MRVFLDTNVLVSAVATRGICADVLREVLVSHRLVVSSDLLREIEKVLHEKVKVPQSLISEFIALIEEDALLSEASPLSDIKIRDKRDVPILSAALNAGADLFVTGDKELLELRKVGDTEIVSPRSFWEKLKSGHSGEK